MGNPRARILYIENSGKHRDAFAAFARAAAQQLEWDCALSDADAQEQLRKTAFDAVVYDGPRGDGSLQALIANHPDIPIIALCPAENDRFRPAFGKTELPDLVHTLAPGLTLEAALSIALQGALRHRRTLLSLNMLSQAIMRIRESVFITDLSDRIIFVNSAFTRMYGWQPAEIIGANCSLLWKRPECAHEKRRLPLQVSGTRIFNVRRDGSVFPVYLSRSIIPRGADGQETVITVVTDISDVKQAQEEVRESQQRFHQLAESIEEVFWLFDVSKKRMLYVSPAFTKLYGTPDVELLKEEAAFAAVLSPECRAHSTALFAGRLQGGYDQEYQILAPNGQSRWIRERTFAINSASGKLERVSGIVEDITEQKRLQLMGLQHQKLQSIGQLAAGIAHEINTPVQYIRDNTKFVRSELGGICRLLALLEQKCATNGGEPSSPAADIAELAAELQLDYLLTNIPKAMDAALKGLDRVAQIVRSMRDFAYAGGEVKTPGDINRALENTLVVSTSEWKYIAEIDTDFDSTLPEIACYHDELNQAFLNLILNAADAIRENAKGRELGKISVSTKRLDGDIEVRIKDTGAGIPEHVRDKIFDPFFTTKKLGKGTGQGLAICYQAIVQRHGGTISFTTEVGKGTEFVLTIPINSADTEEKAPDFPGGAS